MGNLTLNGATSGQITISPTAVAGTNTLTLPAATGTVALTANPTFTGTTTVSNLAMNGSSSGTTTLSPSATASGTVTIPAGTGTVAVQGVSTNIVSGTAQASTSGTSIDFTSIPSWVKRVTVMFNGVSTNGTNFYQIQVGTGGSPTTSGYSAQTTGIASSVGSSSSSTSGFPIYTNAGTYAWSGAITLFNVSGNIWVASGLLGNPNTNALLSTSSGTVTLSGVLNIVRITTVGGTDTFDAGSINILYE